MIRQHTVYLAATHPYLAALFLFFCIRHKYDFTFVGGFETTVKVFGDSGITSLFT